MKVITNLVQAIYFPHFQVKKSLSNSGAGKTTLLAAISRRDKSAMTGYLMLNGRLAGADLIARISGFVPQQDLAIEDLNVIEHMEFMVSG
jgi:ABC-type multidrug transport system ATPase subunit